MLARRTVFAVLVWLLCCSLGCKKEAVEEPSAQDAETAAETEYANSYLQLMVEFRDNAIKSNDELDEAEEKGLPQERAKRRELLFELLERGDRRMEALLAKAKAISPPPAYEGFHAAVVKFFQDMVDGNAKYLAAARAGKPNTSGISDDNVETMKENYEAMRAEGQKLGIPIAALGDI